MISLRIRPNWKRSRIRMISYNSSSNILMKKLRGWIRIYKLEKIGLRNYWGLIVSNWQSLIRLYWIERRNCSLWGICYKTGILAINFIRTSKTWIPNPSLSVANWYIQHNSTSLSCYKCEWTLPTMSELSTNYLPVVSTTMTRVSRNVGSTHSQSALLGSGSTSRPPLQGLPGISLPVSIPLLVTTDVRLEPVLMSLTISVI